MKLKFGTSVNTLHLQAETPEDKYFLLQTIRSYMEPKKPPLAEVFIELQPDGLMHLRSERNGRFDSSYGPKPQERVMTIELPKLIAELREPFRPLPEHMTT